MCVTILQISDQQRPQQQLPQLQTKAETLGRRWVFFRRTKSPTDGLGQWGFLLSKLYLRSGFMRVRIWN